MTSNKNMRHNLPDDLNKAIEDVLSETAITHWVFWEMAFTARAQMYTLLDKQESITDPVHAQICQELIQECTRIYNGLTGIFLNAGLQAEARKYHDRHKRSITIIRDALSDPRRSD